MGSKCSQWCAFYDNYSISVLGCIKTNDMDNLSDGNWLNLANFHCRAKLVHQNSRYNWYRPWKLAESSQFPMYRQWKLAESSQFPRYRQWKLANWKSSSPHPHQFVCECVSVSNEHLAYEGCVTLPLSSWLQCTTVIITTSVSE